MTHDPMISVQALGHDYGQGPVLDIDRLELGPGVHHLTGPNGAGKTTLLRILATLLTPLTGSAQVAGFDVRQQGLEVRARMGFAGHRPSLHPELTVAENLALHARLHSLPTQRVELALEDWLLEDRSGVPVRSLSHGQARRADLARATLHDPQVLLLDEPAAGLDEASSERLRDHLEAPGRRLVLVAGHGAPPVTPEATVRLEGGEIRGGDDP